VVDLCAQPLGEAAWWTATALSQTFTGRSDGSSSVLPDSTSGKSRVIPCTSEAAYASEPHTRTLVAAAAMTTRLRSVCLTLVVFLLEEGETASVPHMSQDPIPMGRPCPTRGPASKEAQKDERERMRSRTKACGL
jgi:hypothetical protein